jgi:hypothetical protein
LKTRKWLNRVAALVEQGEEFRLLSRGLGVSCPVAEEAAATRESHLECRWSWVCWTVRSAGDAVQPVQLLWLEDEYEGVC